MQKERRATTGLKKTARALTIETDFLAQPSAFCCAILFGTNSPKISVKKEIIIVMKMTDRVLRRLIEPGHPKLLSHATRCSESTSAENAAPKKPARVILI